MIPCPARPVRKRGEAAFSAVQAFWGQLAIDDSIVNGLGRLIISPLPEMPGQYLAPVGLIGDETGICVAGSADEYESDHSQDQSHDDHGGGELDDLASLSAHAPRLRDGLIGRASVRERTKLGGIT
jgi:hypothetical protein